MSKVKKEPEKSYNEVTYSLDNYLEIAKVYPYLASTVSSLYSGFYETTSITNVITYKDARERLIFVCKINYSS